MSNEQLAVDWADAICCGAKIQTIDYIYYFVPSLLLFAHTYMHTATPSIGQWQVSHGRFGIHRDRWRARLQGLIGGVFPGLINHGFP